MHNDDIQNNGMRMAIELADRPVALILSRQDVPTLDRNQFAEVEICGMARTSARIAVEAGISQG